VVLTYWIGRLAWGGTVGRWAGALAAVLVAFSSPTLRWEHFLMTEGLFAFLLTLVVFSIVLGLRRAGWWPWAAAGLALGLAILSRSAGQVVFFVVPPMVLLVERSWRAAIWKTAVMFAALRHHHGAVDAAQPGRVRRLHHGRRGRPEPRDLHGDHPPSRLLV